MHIYLGRRTCVLTTITKYIGSFPIPLIMCLLKRAKYKDNDHTYIHTYIHTHLRCLPIGLWIYFHCCGSRCPTHGPYLCETPHHRNLHSQMYSDLAVCMYECMYVCITEIWYNKWTHCNIDPLCMLCLYVCMCIHVYVCMYVRPTRTSWSHCIHTYIHTNLLHASYWLPIRPHTFLR